MASKKANEEKNPTVIINLDRPREIRFGHKAMKMLTKLTDKSVVELTQEEFNLEELEKILYCGLLSDSREHGETLKLEDMEDLLDMADSYGAIIDAMNQAFDRAFQLTETQKN
jgi:hypothetical protein